MDQVHAHNLPLFSSDKNPISREMFTFIKNRIFIQVRDLFFFFLQHKQAVGHFTKK